MRGFYMEFSYNLKIDKQRTVNECFKYFSQNILDIETAMKGINNGNFVTIGSISFGFSQDIAIQWTKFLTSILKIKQLTKVVSFKTIDKEMKNIFKEYLSNPNIEIFVKFQDTVKYLEKYKVELNYYYFTITGLKTSNVYHFDNIKIGSFDQKCPIDKISFLEKIQSNNEKIIQYREKNNPLNSIEEDYYKQLSKSISEYRENIILEVSNFGDEESSLIQSISDADSFINEILFLTKNATNLEFDISFNSSSSQNSAPLMVNYSNNKTSTTPTPLKHPVYLDFKNNYTNGIQIGYLFKKLNFPLYSKNNKDELIEKVKTAINWYSSSLKTSNNRESFLFCAIGIEALLTNGRDAITKTLSENTAFLIANKDKASRKYIYSQMTYLYSQRSGIAHGGNANIEIKDLNQLRYYLSACITTIIFKIQKNEINSLTELYEHLEDLKFS